jgi:hypothetical protein
MDVREAVQKHGERLAESMGYDLTPREADDDLNESARNVIRAVKVQHGTAWLIRLNPWKPTDPYFWEWDGGMVYNFGADYVVPKYDEEIARLLDDWRQVASVKTLDAMSKRAKELGGATLVWS